MTLRLQSRSPFFPKRFLALVALASIAPFLTSGCATSTSESEAPEQKYQVEWPAPPDAPRFIYETTLRSEANIRAESEDGRMKKMLTGRGSVSEALAYRKPSAVASRGGRIYVADPPTGAIVVFDAQRSRAFRMGLREPNNIVRPVSLATDKKGQVYVLDGKLRKVMVYDVLGLFLFAVGDPKALTQPTGVAVSEDGQKIFVVDRGSLDADDHKVIAYSPDGAELYRIGPRGSEPGQLNIPLAATVTSDGRLVILDSGNFRVQTFDLEGKYQSSFGSVGNGLGQFSRPRSIASDLDGNIYVSDTSFNNVQIFNPAGQLLMWLGAPGMQNLPGRFGLIAGIAVDETGRLYISDQYHLKVEVYRPTALAGQQAPRQ